MTEEELAREFDWWTQLNHPHEHTVVQNVMWEAYKAGYEKANEREQEEIEDLREQITELADSAIHCVARLEQELDEIKNTVTQ